MTEEESRELLHAQRVANRAQGRLYDAKHEKNLKQKELSAAQSKNKRLETQVANLKKTVARLRSKAKGEESEIECMVKMRDVLKEYGY